MILFLKNYWHLLKLRWEKRNEPFLDPMEDREMMRQYNQFTLLQEFEKPLHTALSSRLQRCREWRDKADMTFAWINNYADRDGPVFPTHT